MSRHLQDGLLKHSVLLFLATQVGNVSNVLFQVLMNRSLSTAEYGVLATTLSLILVTGTPLAALTTAAAHSSARLVAAQRIGDVRILARRWALVLLIPAVMLLALVCGLAAHLAAWFKIEDVRLMYLAGALMALGLFPPTLLGMLQGVQSFVWFGLGSQVWGVVRLVAGALLVWLVSAAAGWVLVGQLAGLAASVLFAAWALRSVLSGAPATGQRMERMTDGLAYFVRSLAVLLAFAFLMNADILLVKHYFNEEEAGWFARAATIGRMIIFLPMPVAGALFPKVVSTGAMSSMDRRLLWQAIGYTVLIIAGAAAAVTVLMPYVWLVFTRAYPSAAMLFLARSVIWAMAPLGLTYLLLNFEMAQNRFGPALLLMPCAIAYAAGVALWHGALLNVVAVLGGAALLSVLILLAGLAKMKTIPGPDEMEAGCA